MINLHSSPMLGRSCLKYCMLGSALQLPDIQARFRKGRGTRDQIANICWIIEKATEFQKIIYLCFMVYTKAFDCVDYKKLWKTLKEMGIPDLSPEKPVPCKFLTVASCMEQLTGSRLRKEYDKAVYCHPVYLTFTQSTSCEIPGWMSSKLESRLL